MGILSGLFGKDRKETSNSTLPWITLNSVEQLQAIKENSYQRPQLIFKHSTSCGVSRMVLSMFTSSFSLEDNQLELYFLDLLSYRKVSNAVAETYGVGHQSPQVLVIRDGMAIHHASHGEITNVDWKAFN